MGSFYVLGGDAVHHCSCGAGRTMRDGNKDYRAGRRGYSLAFVLIELKLKVWLNLDWLSGRRIHEESIHANFGALIQTVNEAWANQLVATRFERRKVGQEVSLDVQTSRGLNVRRWNIEDS